MAYIHFQPSTEERKNQFIFEFDSKITPFVRQQIRAKGWGLESFAGKIFDVNEWDRGKKERAIMQIEEQQYPVTMPKGPKMPFLYAEIGTSGIIIYLEVVSRSAYPFDYDYYRIFKRS